MAPIDLYIVGSVAVSVDGTRLGKGKDGKKEEKTVFKKFVARMLVTVPTPNTFLSCFVSVFPCRNSLTIPLVSRF